MYRTLCLTHSEKVVEGFIIKHCNKPGGEWIIRSNRNPVSSTKKEMSQPYPATTDTEAEPEGKGVSRIYPAFTKPNASFDLLASHWHGYG